MENIQPKNTHKLKHWKTSLLTGSPVKPDLYDYIRNSMKDIFIHNGSGGTDVCAAFIGANPIIPIHAGELQCPELGVAIECWNENGERCPNGVEGDLVITKPLPNMPLGFLGDDEKKTRLRDTYFNHFPNKQVWYQADYSEILSSASIELELMPSYIDSRCEPENPGHTHVRPIRRCVESSGSKIWFGGVVRGGGGNERRVSSPHLIFYIPSLSRFLYSVDDCIAVGQKLADGDERVVLFVKPLQGDKLSPELVKRIQEAIRDRLSRRHVPAKILFCDDIPVSLF